MSEQLSKYGAIYVETPVAAPPKRRGVVLALCLLAGGALFAVAGPDGQRLHLHDGRRQVSRHDGCGQGPGGNGRERLDAATPK